jgi:chloramphenicol 3-O-phosphotransferase
VTGDAFLHLPIAVFWVVMRWWLVVDILEELIASAFWLPGMVTTYEITLFRRIDAPDRQRGFYHFQTL